jgi:hypothetical protein
LHQLPKPIVRRQLDMRRVAAVACRLQQLVDFERAVDALGVARSLRAARNSLIQKIRRFPKSSRKSFAPPGFIINMNPLSTVEQLSRPES